MKDKLVPKGEIVLAPFDPRLVKDYQRLGYEKLHAEIQHMIQRAQVRMLTFNEEERQLILPALEAMKSIVSQPGRRFVKEGSPNWEDECKLLGLSAGTIRQWKARTGAEHDLRLLLGETPRERKPKIEQTDLLHKISVFAKAYYNGEDKRAEHILSAIVEEYDIPV